MEIGKIVSSALDKVNKFTTQQDKHIFSSSFLISSGLKTLSKDF